MEFSHTYIGFSPLDEVSSETFMFNLTSDKYILIPLNGYIEYKAIDNSHTWRVNMAKNQFGNRMVEIKHYPSSLYETGFQVI